MTSVQDAATAVSWEDELRDAFAALLGRPLAEFDPDAEYATYFGGNFIHEIGFDQDAVWLGADALSGAEPVVWDYPPFDQGEEPLRFAASRSIYELDLSSLPAAFVRDASTAAFSGGLIRGRDLAPLLVRHGLDLAALPEAWSLPYPRVVSDGTLLGALRAATALEGGPDTLLDVDVEPDEEWAETLATIPRPELRAHLSFFCSDQTEGLGFLGDDRSGGTLLAEEGCALIANWEEGQCQIEFAVVQLSPLVAGDRPPA